MSVKAKAAPVPENTVTADIPNEPASTAPSTQDHLLVDQYGAPLASDTLKKQPFAHLGTLKNFIRNLPDKEGENIHPGAGNAEALGILDECALLASYAYTSPEKMKEMRDTALAHGYEDPHILKGGSVEVGVTKSDNVLVIAPAGTNVLDPGDILRDASAFSREGPLGGRVHHGFSTALDNTLNTDPKQGKTEKDPETIYQNLKKTIREHIQTYGPNAKIVITGHSLGGAISEDLACRLSQEPDIAGDKKNLGEYISGVVTFGQPRVGDRTAAEKYNEIFGDRTLRIVNQQDIVPQLPPRTLGYAACGSPYSFGSKGLRISGNGHFETIGSEHNQPLIPFSGLMMPVDGSGIFEQPAPAGPETETHAQNQKEKSTGFSFSGSVLSPGYWIKKLHMHSAAGTVFKTTILPGSLVGQGMSHPMSQYRAEIGNMKENAREHMHTYDLNEGRGPLIGDEVPDWVAPTSPLKSQTAEMKWSSRVVKAPADRSSWGSLFSGLSAGLAGKLSASRSGSQSMER